MKRRPLTIINSISSSAGLPACVSTQFTCLGQLPRFIAYFWLCFFAPILPQSIFLPHSHWCLSLAWDSPLVWSQLAITLPKINHTLSQARENEFDIYSTFGRHLIERKMLALRIIQATLFGYLPFFFEIDLICNDHPYDVIFEKAIDVFELIFDLLKCVLLGDVVHYYRSCGSSVECFHHHHHWSA